MNSGDERLRAEFKHLLVPVDDADALRSVIRQGRASRRRSHVCFLAQLAAVLVLAGALGLCVAIRSLPARSEGGATTTVVTTARSSSTASTLRVTVTTARASDPTFVAPKVQHEPEVSVATPPAAQLSAGTAGRVI